MTPHPTRLALLISLMGVGLSAGSQETGHHESARAEMARVLHALGLDAAEHAAEAAPTPARRTEPSGARLGRLDEPLAVSQVDGARSPLGSGPGNAAAVPDEPADVSPTDRVLTLLATLVGLPDAALMRAKPTITPAMADAEPASTDQIDKPAGISPTQRVVNDLAALRGKSEAEEAKPAHAPWGGETVAMDASRLDGVRGGFIAQTGLKLSFGIERAVYINGTLVTTTALNVSDLSNLSAGHAALASLNGGTLAIVQSGTGNTFLPGAVSASSIGTVIQNTLDNQHIQSVTTINATVNSGEIVRSLNLQQSVLNAITSSR